MNASILMRLALAVEMGTNEDLTLVREPKDSDDTGTGSGDSDDSEQGDESEQGDGSGDSEQGDEQGESGEGESGESGEEDGDEQGGDSGGSGDSEGESGEGDSGEGESGEGESGEGESGKGGDDEATGNGDGGGDSEGGEGYTDGGSSPSDPSGADKEGPQGAGGHCDLGEDPQAFLEGLLEAMSALEPGESPLLDNSEAMAQVVEELREDDCKPGEAVWRPYDEAADEIVKPRGDKRLADQYRKDAKILTAAMRTMFRRRFLQNRHPQVVHGVRKGIGLSQERMVRTWVEVQSGLKPSAPDYDEIESDAPTIAVAVVGDESGSMQGRPAQAAATAMIALAEAFDSLGCPVMCCGPRNGRGYSGNSMAADQAALENIGQELRLNGSYHRHHASRIDLFKDWDESFRQCKDRFGSYTATGGTPLSDGIQYALRALNERPERFRIVVVLTDGEPDYSHTPVVRRQIRLAREAGIHVIGIGIEGAEYSVPALFPDNHIVVEDLQQLPKKMLGVVQNIVFPKAAKKAKFDGKAGRGKSRKARRF